MYLLRSFRRNIYNNNENYVIYTNPYPYNRNNFIFKTVSIQYGKYKKTCKINDDMVIISNYKYNKLHNSSKYVNISLQFIKNKVTLYHENGINYIQNRNGDIMYMYNGLEELYFINKCIIKRIYDWHRNYINLAIILMLGIIMVALIFNEILSIKN